MFYNLGIAGRAMRRIGAVEFATTIAPGLRDVLLTGKIKEIVVRNEKRKPDAYDAIVVDAPPTGRISRFLDVTKAVSELAKGGPVHSQAEGVVKILHSPLTAVHLVTLLEALPVQETLEAIEELRELDRFVRGHTVHRFGPVREVEKTLVLEIAFDSIHESKRHKSGVAMRFPRINRLRWDKPPGEADRIEARRQRRAAPS